MSKEQTNQNPITNPPQPQTSPPPPSAQPNTQTNQAAIPPRHPELDSGSKRKWLVPALVFSVIVLLGLVGFFGYEYFKQDSKIVTNEQPTQNTNPTSTPDLTINWKNLHKLKIWIYFSSPAIMEDCAR